MNMQIEIYDERELDSATLEPEKFDEETLDIIESMGLEGQKSLIVTNNDNSGTRIPYPKFTKDQQFIALMMFGKMTSIEAYDKGPIPVRVLKEAAFAKEMFSHIYVLHTPPAIISDPILIGCAGASYSIEGLWAYGSDNAHMIARWGDALASWSDLMTQCTKIHVDRRKGELLSIISDAKHYLAKIEEGVGLKQDITPLTIESPFN